MPRAKTGGRKKGTPNKATQDVQEKLDKLGLDPIEGMARVGVMAEKEGDLKLAGKMYAELSQYIAPKRKSIEHSGQDGGPISFVARIPAKAETSEEWEQQHGG